MVMWYNPALRKGIAGIGAVPGTKRHRGSRSMHRPLAASLFLLGLTTPALAAG